MAETNEKQADRIRTPHRPPILTENDMTRFLAREKLHDLERLFFFKTLPTMLKKWKAKQFVATPGEIKTIFFAFQEILVKQIEVDKIDIQFNFESRERPDEFYHLLAVSLTCWAYGDFKAEATEICGLFEAWEKLETGRPSWELIAPFKGAE